MSRLGQSRAIREGSGATRLVERVWRRRARLEPGAPRATPRRGRHVAPGTGARLEPRAPRATPREGRRAASWRGSDPRHSRAGVQRVRRGAPRPGDGQRVCWVSMGRARTARVVLLVLAVCAGLYVIAALSLHALGFGPAIVVLTNSGTERSEVVQVVEVEEGLGGVLHEHTPLRLAPGERSEVELERRGDAKVQVRLTSAAGVTQRFTIEQYLSHGTRLELALEIANGSVTRARARSRGDEVSRPVRWASDQAVPDTAPGR
jgi:hypothetical protein